MECPCKICLMLPVCGNKLVQNGNFVRKYLIVEFAEQCPYILEYFGVKEDGHINHSYDKIYELCKLFGADSEDCFVWRANQIGIY